MTSNPERAGEAEPHNDIAAVQRLMAMCRKGAFYEDHDLSWEVLGEAESAFHRISDRLLYGAKAKS